MHSLFRMFGEFCRFSQLFPLQLLVIWSGSHTAHSGLMQTNFYQNKQHFSVGKKASDFA